MSHYGLNDEMILAAFKAGRYVLEGTATRSTVSGNILATRVSKFGYRTVNFEFNGKRTAVCVHRIIALLMKHPGVPTLGLHVNHIDGDKANSQPGNLEWLTVSENQKHAYRTGLRERKHAGSFKRGAAHPSAKLDAAAVAEIRKRLADGERPAALAPEYGVHRMHICRIGRGEQWKKP